MSTLLPLQHYISNENLALHDARMRSKTIFMQQKQHNGFSFFPEHLI